MLAQRPPPHSDLKHFWRHYPLKIQDILWRILHSSAFRPKLEFFYFYRKVLRQPKAAQ